MSQVSKAALQVAISQLGAIEEPKNSNWGPAVQGYLASVDIFTPAPWCMAFVYWCFKQTGLPAGIYKTGHVLTQYKKSHQYVVTTPQPGDVFIMDYGGGKGHTGIVEEVEGDTVFTIEGNSNDEGSREGFEVCQRPRPIKKIKAFLRF